jgi:hypothetical protein
MDGKSELSWQKEKLIWNATYEAPHRLYVMPLLAHTLKLNVSYPVPLA